MAKGSDIPGSIGTPATQSAQSVMVGRAPRPGAPTEAYLQVGRPGGAGKTTQEELDARLAEAAAARAAQAAADAAAGAAAVASARESAAGIFGGSSSSSSLSTQDLFDAYSSPGAGGPAGPGTGYDPYSDPTGGAGEARAGGGLLTDEVATLTPMFWLGVASAVFGGWWFFGKRKRR